ncbi:MAG: isoaspartyl peptidase/L-asparaginase [Burkholderiales bacterium]|nr:isoaspartyl peptidase/L-asparaginase [Burkholderiales bacterium]
MTRPVIAIHGGAGTLSRAELDGARERELLAALEAALAAGADVLERRGSSLDAVERAVRVLEDSPLFNAGRGAVFTAAGTVECDACIMHGPTLAAGAVAAVHGVRNPVSLARLVMERSRHVFLAGDGAERFARDQGVELMPASYFHTDSRWQALQRVRAGAKASDGERHGTVGAVALDDAGALAAATSTGGITGKLPGRVGDSPIVGAGTYANTSVAVSASGDGEVFLRCNAAYRVAALTELVRLTPRLAARRTLLEVKRAGGRGGLIVLGADGTVAMPFTTEGMYRGVRAAGAASRLGIFRGPPR